MKSISGLVEDTLIITEDTELHGLAASNVIVMAPATASIYGLVSGDLIVEVGASANIHGVIEGSVVDRGGKVAILSGGTVMGR